MAESRAGEDGESDEEEESEADISVAGTPDPDSRPGTASDNVNIPGTPDLPQESDKK